MSDRKSFRVALGTGPTTHYEGAGNITEARSIATEALDAERFTEAQIEKREGTGWVHVEGYRVR